ncbi:MAG: HEAT repeat domain-containing protein [Planctomycetes bacterium]|nr:HEAT repeat domain-containing protein [Planctomycetota bacterium]
MGLFDMFKKPGATPPSPGRDEELSALVASLRDADPKVRLDACVRIGAMKARAASARPVLEELIVDPDGDVCLAAAEAMSAILRAIETKR